MTQGTKTLYVLPVPRSSVQGRGKYSVMGPNGSIHSSKRSKARGVNIPIGFVPKQDSPKELATGLSELITNPYHGVELNEVTPNIRPRNNWVKQYDDIASRKTITLQTYYEILDDVPEGTYTSIKEMPNMMTARIDDLKTVAPTFLESFKIYLSEGVNVFTNNTQRGRLGIQALENNPKVANSREEVNYDIHEFYIGEKNEAAAIMNKSRSLTKKAIRSLGILQDDYSAFDQYQIAVILGLVGADNSATLVTNKLDDYVMVEKKNRYGTQKERCETFIGLFKSFQESKDRTYIKYLLKQSVNNGVINVSGGIHYWRSKKGIDHLYTLGTDLDKIESMFHNEFQKFDESLPEPNLYADLIDELRTRKVIVA